MKTIAIYNIKGGVGKSTAAVNLACLAAAEGRPTLLWDLDAQGAASYYLGQEGSGSRGSRDVIRRKQDLRDLAIETRFQNLDVIPSLSDIERMAVTRRPVAHFKPRSLAGRAYRALWDELADKNAEK